MKIHTLLAVIAFMFVGSALAADDHNHGHEHKPMHGGIVVEAKDVDYELVANATAVQLHLRDHGKPVDVSQASAKLTMLTGTQRQVVDLKPAGNKLEATGAFEVGPGTKVVAIVTIAGKLAGTVRFSIK
ncbi:MAG: hypothetical protein WA888_15460 [Burkholderiaceae bacterium]